MPSSIKKSASPVPRRNALAKIGKAAAATALLPFLRSCAGKRTHNLIFILTDDHRWNAMSCAGDRYVNTPHMDRLAAEGMRFTNAFVTTSLCSPSRASFLTGKYVHTHGKWDNITTELSPEHKTFPHYLQEAGYETAFIGKWHMNSNDMRRSGFDHWVSFKGQGVYFNPELNINGERVKEEGYNTDILTDHAIQWLEKRSEKPFCLYLSFKAVHGPFSPPPRHENTYAGLDIIPPETLDEDMSDKPVYFQEWMGDRKIDVAKWKERWKEFARKYYGALAAVDENLGRLHEALDERGLLSSTTVVYAGDNGYLFGEHGGLGDKRMAYEESIRIPFIVCSPEISNPGSINEELLLNIDLAPTFLDLTGVPIPEDMQGSSFRPLMQSSAGSLRESFLYEYRRVKPYDKNHPTMFGVRNRKWKYLKYPEFPGQEELYDLVNDPIEEKNLADDPKFREILENLRKELERLMSETGAQ